MDYSDKPYLDMQHSYLRSLQVSPFHPVLHSFSHCPLNLSHLFVCIQFLLHCLLQSIPKYPGEHTISGINMVNNGLKSQF